MRERLGAGLERPIAVCEQCPVNRLARKLAGHRFAAQVRQAFARPKSALREQIAELRAADELRTPLRQGGSACASRSLTAQTYRVQQLTPTWETFVPPEKLALLTPGRALRSR